jgi:cytochrome c peroxidase
MKTLALAVGTLLSLATGCIDQGPGDDASSTADDDGAPDESTQFDEIVARHCDQHNVLPNNVPVLDATGVFTTASAHGAIDLNNEFFQDLGGNGRRCVSCHVPTAGWTITPKQLHTVFDLTDGGDFEDGLGLSAVFRTVDGSNSPKADVSTLAKRRQAYSMLLDKGVIRIGLPIPANAEFDLIEVDDPYKFASARELSLFRRPLPTTNLKFDSTVMWDGREVVPGATVASELATQANSAAVAHAQSAPLSQKQRESIVEFETALASAQVIDRRAGDLRDDGAMGGPGAILQQPFYIGINDNFGDSRTGAAFNPLVFDIFDRWTHARGRHSEHRRSVARGQALFNSKAIKIEGVSGINDEDVFGKPAVVVGTCTTCHNTPNGGNHSVVAPLNIGLVDASRRTPDMPLYTLRNKTTGEIVKVTDPGRALIDGKWSHIGRFKGPMLRNLAPRAPYFHNGFAADLDAVVDFYNERFAIGFTKQERADIIAFLRSL